MDSDEWQIQDDRVMGGSSQSYIYDMDDYMTYNGTIVTANGGFTSTRTNTFASSLDLTNYLAIALTVRSEENSIYRFGLHGGCKWWGTCFDW